MGIRVLEVGVSAATVGASQLYYAYEKNFAFDVTPLFFGVVVPLLVGCSLLFFTDQRVLLFGFIAIFWSVVDERPVFFDSVLTWPRVTRFHPYLPHLAVEIALHVLTFAFLFASVRIALGRSRVTRRRANLAYMLAFLAFIVSYFQNIPMAIIGDYVNQSWYQLDVLEHLVAALVYGLALWVARARGSVRTEALAPGLSKVIAAST